MINSLRLDLLVTQGDNPAVSSLACDILSFWMRYNVQIDFVDFSAAPEFVRTIRRFQQVNQAKEMEDLTRLIVSVKQKVDMGGGSNYDSAYIESRIHDKVREALAIQGMDGPTNTSRTLANDQASIVAYYQKSLTLMQD